ncbi:hypothetical protein GCM10017687_72290 [Streptomyces echinatus]
MPPGATATTSGFGVSGDRGVSGGVADPGGFGAFADLGFSGGVGVSGGVVGPGGPGGPGGPAGPGAAPSWPGPGRTPHPAAPGLATAVQRECLQRGLIVELGGRHASVVRLLPPLTISDEQATAVLDRLADAVAAVARHHKPHEPRQQRHPGPAQHTG